jgi:superfamily II DNA/RNA helicase
VGNSPVKRQKEKLKLKPHVVVGSLGRMLELMAVKKLKMHKCKTVVIDEADRMLLDKTIPDIEAFIAATPSENQVIFASASEQNDALATARHLRPNLEHVQATEKPLDESVDHYFIKSDHHRKDDTVRQLLNALNAGRIIVFLHKNEGVADLNAMLAHQEYKVVEIHGQCDKFERQKALTQFRKGTARVLIASDVAARGLDIKGVDAIINLDLPSQAQDYVHRVGRTGRAGATGISISLVANNEMPILKRYQKELGIELTLATLARGEFSPSK